MAVKFTMTLVSLQVKNIIIDDTIQNMKAAGRLQDGPKLVGYRHHLSRASASRIIKEWETSKRILQ